MRRTTMRQIAMRQIATRQALTLAAALTLVPTAAFAHPGIGEMHGFTHGFAHPLGGLDHMLAMVTVGIFAWQLGGRALWLVPAAFVAAMALGGALAMTGVPVPMVETGIAASVIVLGATVALGIKAPVAIAMGLVGLFAIFHGHAHGAEMPLASLPYGVGFIAATAMLHGIGIAAGLYSRGTAGWLVRAGGAAVAATGLLLLIG
jgi:urease accessory protein